MKITSNGKSNGKRKNNGNVTTSNAMAITKAIAKPNALRALLLIFTPLCSGGRAEEKPEGWPARMPASLASGQDALSTNPVARTRTSPVTDR